MSLLGNYSAGHDFDISYCPVRMNKQHVFFLKSLFLKLSEHHAC